jgi:hypothetical protein
MFVFRSENELKVGIRDGKGVDLGFIVWRVDNDGVGT